MRFLIWGGGGHGKVVADLIRATGGTVTGFIDSHPSLLNLQVEPGGGRVLLTEDAFQIRLQQPAGIGDVADAVAIAIGTNALRLDRVRRLGALAAPPLQHPAAVVSASAWIGAATVVFAGAIVNADARLGDAVIANTACVIEHDCRIGEGAHISPGAVLAGGVTVGARTWIGAGATVIQGVSIGADALVGAGAVVIRDVPDGARVAGVPARPLREAGRL
jgi:sugar O-acyltransferase (sialic acid O-acetyltransferase NeuD family)